MKKPVNHLAQTGIAEDLVWSIINDAETEAHIERWVLSKKRDEKHSQDQMEIDLIDDEISKVEKSKEKVREARYRKQNLLYAMFGAKGDMKMSCSFKHQALSFAEMRDAKDANLDENLQAELDECFQITSENFATYLSMFIGVEIRHCMACLFEKNKIEGSSKTMHGTTDK